MNKKTGKLPKKAKIAIVAVIVLIITALSIIGNNIIVKHINGNVGYNTEHLDEGTHLTEVPEGYEAIRTQEELMAISSDIANFSKKYILMNDIDLAGENWKPIGNYINKFTGVFDGNNYKINNLTIELDETATLTYIGMFANTEGATIKNIKLETTNINITSKYSLHNDSGTYVGGIIGNAGNGTIIENVSMLGDITLSETGNNTPYVGGIVGCGKDIEGINNANSIGNIVVELKNSQITYAYIGGIIGNGDKVENSYSDENIKVTSDTGKDTYIGGIAGVAGNYIKNSYSRGEINATQSRRSS